MNQPDSREQPSKTPPVPIVAIGASAGGLEAMSSLLPHLSPTTGLVFMYIQHIGPAHADQLTDILSRLTKMPVQEARNRTPIRANHLYIIPPDQVTDVVEGVLMLKPRRSKTDLNLPIDQFFSSLAARHRAASIGILLSGTINDGTLGLKAIKAAGGITVAQDESARFQGMLKSAINEGVVDKVLSLQDIAREIEWFSRQNVLFQQTVLAEPEEDVRPEKEASTDSEDLIALLKLLRKTIGIDFSHYKMATIWRRVIRRMAIYKLPTLPDYTDYLRKHPAEGGLLYNDLLINVTSFFRDTETMDYLSQVLLPQLLLAKLPYEPFRLWVSACSTGEEVYSLAIMLQEVLDEQDLHLPIQIFATDLSERVIVKARLGHYASSQMTGVSPKRLKRFFTKDEDGYRINKGIRDLCVFATHNVFADPPFSRIDLISCRNLLIYTDNSLQRKAIATFHYALNPTGYLLLGKAETVGSSTSLFAQVVKNHKIYLRKNNGVRSVMPMVEPPDSNSTGSDPDLKPRPSQERLPAASTSSDPLLMGQPTRINRIKAFERASLPTVSMLTPGHPDDLDFRVDELLSQYTPASVVVNKDMEILRFRGATSLFLEPAPGKVNFNLLKMARPELVFDLRSIISKANKTGQAVSKTGLQIQVRQQTYYVAINAVPFHSQNQEPFTLVFFEEITPAVIPPTAPAQLRNRRIKQLEEELATLRDDMRSMLEEQEASREELQSANEEIISSNEELQSINEELETSKEEIQSNNEELQTINQELQISNDQLSEAYDYSDAIFGAIRETVIILDKDLRVRSANRAFYKTFKIEPDDAVSRLLYELSNREWDIPALRKLLDQVLNENTVIQGYELTHSFSELGEKVLRLNARKVVRLQGQAAILVAIEDITQHKQVERLLEFLQSIITHAPVAIRLFRSVRNERGTIVDFQLVPLADELGQRDKQSAADLYKNSYKALYSDTGQGNLFSHYIQVVDTGTPLQLEIPVEQGDQARWHLISANRFDDGFLLVTSDITDRKNAEEAVRQREAQLRRLLESTPDVITRWNTDLTLIYANPAFETKIGLPIDQSLGRTSLEMGQPDSIALPYMASLQEVLASGQPKDHYAVYSGPKGVGFFHAQLVPETGQDGAVEGVLAIARDITQLREATDLKQAYETIRQGALDREKQTERLQLILDSSQAALFTLTPLYTSASGSESAEITDFQLQTVNRALARYLGQPPAALPGTSISHWFPDKGPDDNLLDHCRQTYLTGQTQQFDWHHVQAGQDQWLAVAIARIGDELLVTFTDFTRLKHLQQQLEKTVADLKRSNANLEQFAYVASHDLQEPLRKIQQFGNMIQSRYAPALGEEGADLVGRMQSAATRLQLLIRDVLAYSRLSANREAFKPVSLNELVDEILRGLEPATSEPKPLILVDPLPTIQGDRVQLRQLFQNLISNALKFVEPGRTPQLTITARPVTGLESGLPIAPRDEHQRFELIDVRDNGIGFSPDQAERIFEVFHRLHARAAYAGTGVGLAIVQKVVENHQGYITAEGQPGAGATFRMLLPALS